MVLNFHFQKGRVLVNTYIFILLLLLKTEKIVNYAEDQLVGCFGLKCGVIGNVRSLFVFLLPFYLFIYLFIFGVLKGQTILRKENDEFLGRYFFPNLENGMRLILLLSLVERNSFPFINAYSCC